MEESPELRKVSHIGLWIIVLAIGAWLVWQATHTNTENNRFASGSTSNDNHSTRWPFTIDLNLSCVPRDILNKQVLKMLEDERSHGKNTNAVLNSSKP